MNRLLQFPIAQKPSMAERHPLTDYGNAERLVARHGRDLRYCHQLGKWFEWDGKRFGLDDTEEVERRAKDTVRQIYAEAATLIDEKDRADVVSHAQHSESRASIRAMMALAQSEPGIPITPQQLDSDPWLLNVNNGTLNLRTGELQPHDRQQCLTKLVPVDYDPNASCPQWELYTIMAGQQDVIDFLPRAIGYALTGNVAEQSLFLLYGRGSNGKSTFLEVIRTLLGDYSRQADFSSFLHRRFDGLRNDIARLRGARFISAVEAQEGRRLAESVLKQLTGQDTMTARFLFHEHFEFMLEDKLFLAANQKPEIRGTDHAIWRRIRLIPFTVTIPEEDQDKQLAAKLKAEGPGILTWAVRGCLMWQQSGLCVPEAVKAATKEYRSEMDIIGAFIDECVVFEPRAITKSSDLHEAYERWCVRREARSLAAASGWRLLAAQPLTTTRRAALLGTCARAAPLGAIRPRKRGGICNFSTK